jgi:hypothetical protein
MTMFTYSSSPVSKRSSPDIVLATVRCRQDTIRRTRFHPLAIITVYPFMYYNKAYRPRFYAFDMDAIYIQKGGTP